MEDRGGGLGIRMLVEKVKMMAERDKRDADAAADDFCAGEGVTGEKTYS